MSVSTTDSFEPIEALRASWQREIARCDALLATPGRSAVSVKALRDQRQAAARLYEAVTPRRQQELAL